MEEQGGSTDGTPAPGISTGRRVAIGCFMTWIGFLSVGMIGALVARFVTFVTRAPSCPDVPACNWHIYVGFGGLIGAVTLPLLVLWAMSRPKRAETK